MATTNCINANCYEIEQKLPACYQGSVILGYVDTSDVPVSTALNIIITKSNGSERVLDTTVGGGGLLLLDWSTIDEGAEWFNATAGYYRLEVCDTAMNAVEIWDNSQLNDDGVECVTFCVYDMETPAGVTSIVFTWVAPVTA